MSREFSREVIIEFLETYVTTDYKEFDNDSGDWININSTVTSDNKYHMGINVDENYVHDFKTGYTASFVKFAADQRGVSEKEAENSLIKMHMNQLKKGFTPVNKRDRSEDREPIDLEPIYDHTPWNSFTKSTVRNKIGRKALSYIIHRGFSTEHINKFNLKYVDQEECWVCDGEGIVSGRDCENCKGTGKNFYYGRIIIPTYENKKLVYFQGRDFLDRGDFRYMNPRIGKKQVVFFLDNIKEGEPVYICEGPFDAMTLKDYNATCLLGSTISDPQALKIINKNPSEIIFVPDQDEKHDTRSRIIKNMVKNIRKMKTLSDNKIPIGVYKWYLQSDKKDINSANITFIDQSLVFHANRSIEGESLIHG